MDLKGIYEVDKLPDYFVTTANLDYRERINVQAAWQRYIDASISSTVNVPNDFTPQEVKDLYMYAWHKGLKGITIYRDGCERSGILFTNKKQHSRIDKIEELKRELDILIAEELKENPNTCPMCGGNLIHSGGCSECQDCGYSPCSI